MPDTRTETDSMGAIEVPAERYWGAQTQRSLQNFPIGDERMPLAVVHALALIKGAAAGVNVELGLLPEELGRAIEAAAQRVAAGNMDGDFPLVVWQTGSGTQTHMNVNEVIANLANEALGGVRGSRHPVHPNDHVNLCQSSNDTFPSAMQVAACLNLRGLLGAVGRLRKTLSDKATAFQDVVKIGRTHLQDATPLTLGQEISGWAAQLQLAEQALECCLPHVRALPLGGTAVGTGLGAHPEFPGRVVQRLVDRTGQPFSLMENRFAGLAAHDACVGLSGALRQLATACMKIANDVRWLASGPRAGLGEISIPENEPGSSIMPGKINPTQCEALTMVAAQVMGNDVTIGLAGSQGNFELNVYKPVIAHNLLQSIRLLTDGCQSFDQRCAAGIEPNRAVLESQVERSLMLVTALSPVIGYDDAARIAHHAHQRGLSLRAAAAELGLVSGEVFDQYVDPRAMTRPGRG